MVRMPPRRIQYSGQKRRLMDRDRSTRAPYGFSKTYRRVARGIGRARAGLATPIFSETWNPGTITNGGGGVWGAQMSAIPQVADYSALYRTFRILKFEVIVVPQSPVNMVNGNTGATYEVSRLAYSIDNSAEVSTPTSELDVLKDDSSRIRQLSTPFRIVCNSPKARVTVGSAGGSVGVDLGRSNWLSFDDGAGVVHNGVPYWCTGTAAYGPAIYFKVTFQCRDPR